jgi:hypothetical protein
VHLADQRVDVLGELVPERHRLGVLQVRESWCDGVGQAPGLCQQRLLQRADVAHEPSGSRTQVQAQVSGNLVVARPTGT